MRRRVGPGAPLQAPGAPHAAAQGFQGAPGAQGAPISRAPPVLARQGAPRLAAQPAQGAQPVPPVPWPPPAAGRRTHPHHVTGAPWARHTQGCTRRSSHCLKDSPCCSRLSLHCSPAGSLPAQHQQAAVSGPCAKAAARWAAASSAARPCMSAGPPVGGVSLGGCRPHGRQERGHVCAQQPHPACDAARPPDW